MNRTKHCKTCGEDKGRVAFYAQPGAKDGLMHKCKECHKAYVRQWHRDTRTERVTYEKERAQRPERKAKALEYQRRRRARNPEKDAARSAVARAVKVGTLVPLPCRVCNDVRVQAHHEDYSRALDVDWLCFVHHRERHGQTGTAVDNSRHFIAKKVA